MGSIDEIQQELEFLSERIQQLRSLQQSQKTLGFRDDSPSGAHRKTPKTRTRDKGSALCFLTAGWGKHSGMTECSARLSHIHFSAIRPVI
jgi:hypothetical protein